MYDDYLMHYGVPGMKWGVRKATRYGVKKAYKTEKKRLKYEKAKTNYLAAKNRNKSQRKIARLEKKFDKKANTYLSKRKEYFTYANAFAKKYGKESAAKYTKKVAEEIYMTRIMSGHNNPWSRAMTITLLSDPGYTAKKYMPIKEYNRERELGLAAGLTTALIAYANGKRKASKYLDANPKEQKPTRLFKK